MSFLINQNKTFEEEREAGIVYAPHADAGGARLSTYSAVGSLTPGDMVFSTRSGRLVAVGVVLSLPDLEAPRPAALADSGWSSPGFLAEVEYHELENPIGLYTEVDEEIRRAEDAFDKNGKVKQGSYCEPLSEEFDDYFLTTFADRLPSAVRSLTGSEVPAPGGAGDVAGGTAAAPGPGGTTSAGVEKGGKDRTAYRRAAAKIKIRLRHAGNVEDLARQTGELLSDPGEGRTLRRSYTRAPWCVDLLLPVAGVLIEMKSELDADSIQQGVGQLMLYRSMLVALASELDFDPAELELAFACPDEPDAQLQDDLRRLEIACAWKQRGRWVDNAQGRITGIAAS